MIKKSIIITGASGDIGFAIAQKFAQNGYNIFATYNNNETNIIRVKELEANYSIKVITCKMDLLKHNDIKNTFKTAFDKLDYIDCVICNAGTNKPECLFTDVSPEDLNEIIDTNLKGTLLCNQEALKYFTKQKHGSIINISSIYGIYGGSCEAVYSATKAGLIAFSEAIAQEFGSIGIRVNNIAPGCIQTNMTKCFSETEIDDIKNQTPLARIGQPIDVANVAYFLASDESSFITGETLIVSGGAIKYN